MDALKKSHCTVSEALGIFKASGAGSCVLSHFSQRYPRLPPTNSATPSFALGSYGMAADGMLIPLDARMLANLGQFNRSQYPEQVVNNSIDPPSIHEVG
jgi:ribonuclease BN (tRNA processing enzyme)